MVFIPPGLAILTVNTGNLDAKFSIRLGRYSIRGPQVADNSVPKKQNSLELLIARTQLVIDCKTKRDTAQKVFNDLVNELREINKLDDEGKKQRATLFLLGALLHRYFRVMQEYDDYNHTVYVWYPWYVGNCQLFMAIRDALQFPEIPAVEAKSMTTDAFRQKDLAVMDLVTVVTALEAFRDNMLLTDTKDEPRYKKYEHLNNDVNFEKHLGEIITKYKALAVSHLKQFKAIAFIQSVTTKVSIEHEKIVKALDEWHQLLMKEHANFDLLNFEAIESHITTHIKEVSLREKIIDLLYTPHVKENLRGYKHDSFLLAMKAASSNSAIYTIVGGYSLILKSKGVAEKLKCSIYEALDIETKPEELTPKDMLSGIQFLDHFIENTPDISFDCEFFGGMDKMKTELVQKKQALIISTKPKDEVVEHKLSLV